jgi:HAD superfamily hydrolase (TIGR01549 family)
VSTLRGIIFDIDGTLIDSVDAHTRAWVEVFAEFGYHIPYARVRSLIGMGGDTLLPEVIGKQIDSPEGEKISKRREALFAEKYLNDLQPFPKAHELLVRVHSAGLQVIFATSGEPKQAKILLQKLDARKLTNAKTTSGDAEKSKPEPDIILAALRKAHLSATEAVMIGDTPYDIVAAGKANVRTVAVRCGGWKDGDLKGAAAIYDNPSDLLAHFEALLTLLG